MYKDALNDINVHKDYLQIESCSNQKIVATGFQNILASFYQSY